MPWNKNKKHQKLFYSTELRLKTLKNCFYVVISIEFICNNIFIVTVLAYTFLKRSNSFFMFYAME
jgi:hypothetical protein